MSLSPAPAPSLMGKLEVVRESLGKKHKEREEAKEREEGEIEPVQPAVVANKAGDQKPEPLVAAAEGTSNHNKLMLAGHLAHEFLSRGTVLGRRVEEEPNTRRRYAEVSRALMAGGARIHVPGFVNPAQLAQYLQLNNRKQQ